MYDPLTPHTVDPMGPYHSHRHRIIPSRAARCGLAGAVMSAYTPGPWCVTDGGCQVYAVDTAIATLRVMDSKETRDANARLIAAAPQLVDALRKLLTCPAMLADELHADDYEARSDSVQALRNAGVTL